MKSIAFKRINKKEFTPTLCDVASMYGFRTLTVMYKALTNAYPGTKWHCGTSSVSGSTLIQEIENYASDNNIYI